MEKFIFYAVSVDAGFISVIAGSTRNKAAAM